MPGSTKWVQCMTVLCGDLAQLLRWPGTFPSGIHLKVTDGHVVRQLRQQQRWQAAALVVTLLAAIALAATILAGAALAAATHKQCRPSSGSSSTGTRGVGKLQLQQQLRQVTRRRLALHQRDHIRCTQRALATFAATIKIQFVFVFHRFLTRSER